MVLASDYPFLDILWTMLVFFGWVIWFWLLITVFSDLSPARHLGMGQGRLDLFLIVLPFLGVFIYFGFQGQHMAERRAQAEARRRPWTSMYARPPGIG